MTNGTVRIPTIDSAPALGSGVLSVPPPVEADPASVVDSIASTAAPVAALFHDYLAVFIVAFLVTLGATPIMRRLAVRHGIVDKPMEARKAHRIPVAYLGGVAVFLGIMAGIVFSFFGFTATVSEELFRIHDSAYHLMPVPFSILLGLLVITVVGLLDDVIKLDPRLKIAGQLLAAAALAMEEVGTRVAAGVMQPIGRLMGNQDLIYHIHLPFDWPLMQTNVITIDVIYWAGVAIIAVFVLGATNATNLIDGLDGLASGVTGIAAAGLLVLALVLAHQDDGQLDAARIVLCMALLGACVGFLPHNFNPATIFLGDCGSLLLGYATIAIILTLGDTGRTALVVAGLIIYSIPIIDTVLAIVRRKMAGKPMSAPDDQHLHHMLKRALGVKGAVLTLYAIGALFAVLGVWLSMGRVRVVFTIAMVVAAFIGVTAVKIARRQAIEAHIVSLHGAGAAASGSSGPARSRAVERVPEPVIPAPSAPTEKPKPAPA